MCLTGGNDEIICLDFFMGLGLGQSGLLMKKLAESMANVKHVKWIKSCDLNI